MGRAGVKRISSKGDPEFRFLLAIDPEFEAWRALAVEWFSTITTNNTDRRAALAKFFVEYVNALPIDKKPRALLDAQFLGPDLWMTLRLDAFSHAAGLRHHDYISDFLQWVLRSKYSETDAEGFVVIPPNLRNPFPRKKIAYFGKRADIELRYLLSLDGRLETWRVLANEWLQSQQSLAHPLGALDKCLAGYLLQFDLPRNPYNFLRRDLQKPSFLQWLASSRVERAKTKGTVKGKPRNTASKPNESDAGINNTVCGFLEWILIEKLSVEDDRGQRLLPSEFQNPFPLVSGRGSAQGETLKSPLPYRYIKQLRGMLAQGLTFSDWVWAQQTMERGSRGGDWFVVDPKLVDKSDRDCVWRERSTTEYEQNDLGLPADVTEMWSPVRAVALYIKLELPLRTFQVRMLDSGEADTWRYESGKWRLNDGPLAVGSAKRPSQRGVFHRSTSETGAGFYINTNKTADINKDEKEKGYVIPWTHEQVLYWLEKLRNWQERYNPIQAPTPWRELAVKHFGQTPPPASQLDERGDVCFLFRDATAKGEDRHKPITRAVMDPLWYQLLAELERHCAKVNETLDSGAPVTFVEPNSRRTHFPLHALRVSLITAYALEGGVPFPVLSKLIAGHMRLIMTLYYTVAGTAYVSEIMQEAERKILQNEAASHRRFLMEMSYKEYEQCFAFVTPHGLNAIKQQKSAAGFVFDGKGICPVGGGMCDVGGELLSTGTGRAYGPVPGYPQERNCVRCRFFITVPGFLDGMQAHFNEISYKISECSERYVGFERAVNAFEDERKLCEDRGLIFTQQREYERMCQHQEAEAEKGNKLLTDLQACTRLVARCMEIAKTPSDGGIRLVANGTISDLRFALTETTSELHQLEIMCENAVFYPDIDAGKATLRRSQVLDAMLQMNGKPPIFFRLTPDQQLQVGNDLMKLIQARTGSLRNAVEFAEGKRMLGALGLLDEAAALIEERAAGIGLRQLIGSTATRSFSLTA